MRLQPLRMSRITWPMNRGEKQLKVKVAHTRLPSVGFRSWSRFLAVSLQVTWVINPAVNCHHFPSGLQLPAQPLRRLLPILLLGEQGHNGCEQFAIRLLPDSVATAIWTRAFCAWVQHATTLGYRYIYIIGIPDPYFIFPVQLLLGYATTIKGRLLSSHPMLKPFCAKNSRRNGGFLWK